LCTLHALRARRIPHTIPERDDQKANRARRGRPRAFDRVCYWQRNQVEPLMSLVSGARRRHGRLLVADGLGQAREHACLVHHM
jgi:hypothetical protein